MPGGWSVATGVPVPMRDGVVLRADVYLPAGAGTRPALVQRVPYGRGASRIINGALELARALAAGYAVVVQDVRGRFESEGVFTPFADEGRDGADTIAWVASQPWCDGNVGMIGASYAGLVQWLAAAERPPALKAIAPVVATPDAYDGWVHRDGIFELGFNLLWALRHVGAGTLAAVDDLDALYAETPLHRPGVPFYDDWLDGVRAPRVDPAAVEVPVLSIGGWYDVFARGTLAGHADGAGPRRLVMGPWAHSVMGGGYAERSFGVGADAAVADVTGMQLRWFDRWLKGADAAEPDARVFVTGADYWRDEPAWPPPDARPLTLHLQGGGELGALAPGDGGADTYRYDPADPVPTVGGATFLPGLPVAANAGPRDQRSVHARADVLTYTSAPLSEPLELVGAPEVRLFVSCSAPDTDVVVTLCDVEPSGRALNVTTGALRARYRDSRTEPALLEPGGVYELRVVLDGGAHAFAAGHRVRIAVTGGSFPRYARNPQDGGDENAAALRPAVTTVFHEPGRVSCVVLPVVRREETHERLAAKATAGAASFDRAVPAAGGASPRRAVPAASPAGHTGALPTGAAA